MSLTTMGGRGGTLLQVIAVTSDCKIQLSTDLFMQTVSEILDRMVLYDLNVYI